jgi:hypothetical protein
MRSYWIQTWFHLSVEFTLYTGFYTGTASITTHTASTHNSTAKDTLRSQETTLPIHHLNNPHTTYWHCAFPCGASSLLPSCPSQHSTSTRSSTASKQQLHHVPAKNDVVKSGTFKKNRSHVSLFNECYGCSPSLLSCGSGSHEFSLFERPCSSRT